MRAAIACAGAAIPCKRAASVVRAISIATLRHSSLAHDRITASSRASISGVTAVSVFKARDFHLQRISSSAPVVSAQVSVLPATVRVKSCGCVSPSTEHSAAILKADPSAVTDLNVQ